jgi:CHAD domain
MGYTIEENEPSSLAVKRIAVEQMDLALKDLRAVSDNLDELVHVTRQRLKRLRALVALAHGELGNEVFEREWTCYRSAGRLLARARDAAVVVQTLESLRHRHANQLPPDGFDAIHRYLVERRDIQFKLMLHEEALQEVIEKLVSARERVATWPVRQRGFEVFAEGARRSYRVGRKGHWSVIRHPSPTNFHQWRRPVKILWHQLQILTPIWPAILNAHANELQALSDRLNENHDLDTLRHAALRSQFEAQPHDQRALVSLIDRRSRELESEALPLGERLYIERPTRFMQRLHRYWRAWERSHQNRPAVSDSTWSIAASARQPYVRRTQGTR